MKSDDMAAIVLSVLLVLAAVAAFPLALIWSLGVFGWIQPRYTLETWAAAACLLFLFSARRCGKA